MSKYRISDKPFFKDNPEATAISEFTEIGDNAMKYIALVYAYNSPLSKMELSKRKQEAIKQAKIPKTPTGRPSKLETDLLEMRTDQILKVKKLFLDTQFDEDLDSFMAYCEMLEDFKSFMRKPNKTAAEIDKAIKIANSIRSLYEEKKELAKILELREDVVIEADDDEVDDSKLSAIELFNQSRK